MKRLVVYTAVFGGRDPVRLPPADADFDFAAFTDSRVDDPRVVQIEMLPSGNPRKFSRTIKIIAPFVYLKEYRYSLWIDGSISLKTGKLDHLIDTYLSGDTPLATFRHPSRTCAYQEASVCLSARLDSLETIMAQVKAYKAAGMPEGGGLAELGVVLRDRDRTEDFSWAWSEEVQARSCRDQISFPFAAWRAGLRWAQFQEALRESSLFELMPHN